MKLLIPLVLFLTLAIQNTHAGRTYGMEGVVRHNVEIRTLDTRGRDTDANQIAARYNFPIYRYFGGNVFGSYTISYIGDTAASDINNETWGLGFSAIEGEIGRVGISYADIVDDPTVENIEDTEYETYTIEADYYFQNATIGVDRSVDEYEELDNSNYYEADLIWYFSKNFSTSLQLGGLDKHDSYTYRLRYQPRSFANRFNYSLFYTKAPHTDIFGLNFNFFINSPINMQDRDRNYR